MPYESIRSTTTGFEKLIRNTALNQINTYVVFKIYKTFNFNQRN